MKRRGGGEVRDSREENGNGSGRSDKPIEMIKDGEDRRSKRSCSGIGHLRRGSERSEM